MSKQMKSSPHKARLHPVIEDYASVFAESALEMGIPASKAYDVLIERIGSINDAITRVGSPPRPAWQLTPPSRRAFSQRVAALTEARPDLAVDVALSDIGII